MSSLSHACMVAVFVNFIAHASAQPAGGRMQTAPWARCPSLFPLNWRRGSSSCLWGALLSHHIPARCLICSLSGAADQQVQTGSGQHGVVIAGAPDTPDMNTVVLRARVAYPYLLQQCRRAAGLSLQDSSQVLGTCGVEPYSEAFRQTVGMQDELSAQLSAGE